MRTRRAASLALVVGLAGAVSSSAPAIEHRAQQRTATVVSVTAGDTLDVRLAGGKRERVRLTGVVAPRGGSCGAAAATAATSRWSLGRRVTLLGDPAGRSGASYVRLPGGTDLGRALVGSGLAQIDPADQRFARFAAYVPLQRAAEEGGRGAWGSCAADVAVRLDAPAEPVVVGDRAVYTATLTNAGPLGARDVTLELRARPGTSLVAARSPTGSCRAAGWAASCTFASLPAGSHAVATVTVRADGAGVAPVRASVSFFGCTAACGARPHHDANLGNDRAAALTVVLSERPPPGSPPPASCQPSYPTVCIPPPPPDLDCDDVPHQGFPVVDGGPHTDPHVLDADGDGVACFKADYAARPAAAGRPAATGVASGLKGIEFAVVCTFSHRAPDDPLLFPGRPGLSHGHTFFGNVTTDASSTPATLRLGATTCDRADDRAAYWIPTLLVDDRAVVPTGAKIYYRRETLARVRAFPSGLAMIGGDAAATSAQSVRVTSWDCGDRGPVAPASRVPVCPDARGRGLRLTVRYPDCWDGKRLKSADHRSHMAYSSAGSCPRTHPVAVPALTLQAQYPVTGAGRVELASRGQSSGHGDFVNAWRQRTLQRLVEYCLNALRRCS